MTNKVGDYDTTLDEIIFLTAEEVIYIHSRAIDEISPGEPKNILDYGRLEAAVMAPQQTFGGEYLYSSLHEMAGVYLSGLAMGHAFSKEIKGSHFWHAIRYYKLTV